MECFIGIQIESIWLEILVTYEIFHTGSDVSDPILDKYYDRQNKAENSKNIYRLNKILASHLDIRYLIVLIGRYFSFITEGLMYLKLNTYRKLIFIKSVCSGDPLRSFFSLAAH